MFQISFCSLDQHVKQILATEYSNSRGHLLYFRGRHDMIAEGVGATRETWPELCDQEFDRSSTINANPTALLKFPIRKRVCNQRFGICKLLILLRFSRVEGFRYLVGNKFEQSSDLAWNTRILKSSSWDILPRTRRHKWPTDQLRVQPVSPPLQEQQCCTA